MLRRIRRGSETVIVQPDETRPLENQVLWSVIVPVKYKGDDLHLLRHWIKTNANQPFQVIIVNDLQAGASGQFVQNLISSLGHHNLKYLEGNFGNPGAARNLGLSVADGKWIAFWDSDDLPLVSQFQLGLQLAENENSQILIGSFNLRRDSDTRYLKEFIIKAQNELLSEVTLRPGVWRFAFRREILDDVNFPHSRMGEDQAFLAQLSIFERKISILESPIYEYFTGEVGHLVNDDDAMDDMKVSIRSIRKSIAVQKGQSKELSKQLLVKLLISCLKNGSFQTRIWSLSRLLAALVSDPKSLIKTITILSARG
jgi:glycosyltransferase involved in cell wall biosynthesis